MAVNERTNVVLHPYERGQAPAIEEGYVRYLQDELQRIEKTLRSLTVAGIEVLDTPPLNPVKGMVKYNLWDEFGDGSEGLVIYNGSAWVSV
jgi:hypothetical protein